MATVSNDTIQLAVDKCSSITNAHLKLQNALKKMKQEKQQRDLEQFGSVYQNLKQTVNSFDLPVKVITIILYL